MPQNDTSEGRPLFWEFWACASGFWKRKHARVSWPLTAGSVGVHQLTIPGYLVLGVGLFAFSFTTGMLVIGRKLPAIIQSENQAEAEMLAAATKIRVEDGLAPRSPLWQALREVLERWRQLCWQLMRTTMVSQMDLLLAPVFAWSFVHRNTSPAL
jgi:hypothetical protein